MIICVCTRRVSAPACYLGSPAAQWLAAARHAQVIRQMLRVTAMAEIAIYRDVSLAFMAHLGQILGWPWPKSAALAAGIRSVYAYERLGASRRMVALRMSARRNALGGPEPAQPSHA